MLYVILSHAAVLVPKDLEHTNVLSGRPLHFCQYSVWYLQQLTLQQPSVCLQGFQHAAVSVQTGSHQLPAHSHQHHHLSLLHVAWLEYQPNTASAGQTEELQH